MTLRSVQYDFQQCIMLHIALGNNVATGYNTRYYIIIMHLSMCRPTLPPGRGRDYMGDLTVPQVKFPLMGEGFCVQIPQSTEDF